MYGRVVCTSVLPWCAGIETSYQRDYGRYFQVSKISLLLNREVCSYVKNERVDVYLNNYVLNSA